MSTEHRTSVNIPLAGEDAPRAPRSRKRRPPRRRVIFICAAALIFAAALCLLLFFGLPEDPGPFPLYAPYPLCDPNELLYPPPE